MKVVSSNSQLLIHHRRIVEDEYLFRGRGPISVNEMDLPFQKSFGQLLWIGDGGGTADELRPGPIEMADTVQPPQDIGHMRSENTPVGMELVDHDEFQVLEEGQPFGMVRKNTRMEHIGIGDHNIALRTDGLPRVLGSISIIGKGFDRFLNLPDQVLKFEHLILGKGLGGKEIKSL